MWPFKRRKPVSKTRKAMNRLVAGLIIGGAIGSIVGRNVVDEKKEEHGIEELEELEESEED